MKIARFTVVLAAAFLCAGTASAVAQPAALQKPAPQQNRDASRPPSLMEVQNIVDGWVVIQAQNALALSDAQFPQFVTRLRALQETRRRNQRAHNQLIQEMARLTNAQNPAPDEGVLRDKLQALDDLEAKSAADLRKAYESVDQILDVRQQARFRVFLDQVERRMLDLLTRARGQAVLALPRGRGRGGLR